MLFSSLWSWTRVETRLTDRLRSRTSSAGTAQCVAVGALSLCLLYHHQCSTRTPIKKLASCIRVEHLRMACDAAPGARGAGGSLHLALASCQELQLVLTSQDAQKGFLSAHGSDRRARAAQARRVAHTRRVYIVCVRGAVACRFTLGALGRGGRKKLINHFRQN